MIGREVAAKFGDKTYLLLPTLGAMIKVNRACGSVMSAYEQVKALNFESICSVIAAGAGLTPRQSEALQQEVFDAGIGTSAAFAAEYISLLLNPSGKTDEEGDPGKE